METQWHILERLPELRTQLVDLLGTDTEFRSLCQDYNDCVEALRDFRQTHEQSHQRVREYEQLLTELEADIRRKFQPRDTGLSLPIPEKENRRET